MINPIVIKKYAALFLVGMFSSISFAIGMLFYSFLVGIGTLFAGLITSMLIANLLLRNPFTNMLEGKGMLAVTMDSTGIMKYFNLKVIPPNMKGKVFGKEVNDVFDRQAVFNIEPPGKENGIVKHEDKDGNTHIILNTDNANRSRFQTLHYPLVIWNDQIGSVITKDFLSTQEKTVFAQHQVLYLNRTMENLSTNIRDFGRGVVESLKPKGGLMGNRVVFWVIMGFIVLLLILFAPYVIKTIQGSMGGGVGGAVSSAVGATQAIMPR